MDWWEALVLGTVQGVTEFFPVSSSGHLVMAQELLGLRLPGIGFEIAVHVATLVSVLVVYRSRVLSLCAGCARRDRASWAYVGLLAVATVPAVLVVLLAGDFMEARFDDPAFAGTMLLVTGTFLWSTRWTREARFRPVELLPAVGALAVAAAAGTTLAFLGVLGLLSLVMVASRLAGRRSATSAEPGLGGAVAMGIAQSVAIFPGISRSGSTVVTGLWKRIDPVAAAEFSFLMSVIAIAGAAVQKAPDVLEQGLGVDLLPLAVGIGAAAVSGVLAIRFFVALLARQNFHVFSWYCWTAGAVFLYHVRTGGIA